MKLEEGLERRQNEILDLDNEIKQISTDAEALKESVKKYNELKQKESGLRKIKKQKERDLKIVVNFFKSTEEHYLDNVYPLFKENQEANKRETEAADANNN